MRHTPLADQIKAAKTAQDVADALDSFAPPRQEMPEAERRRIRETPTDYEKRAEFDEDPNARPGKWEISFRTPPVCTVYWTPADWVAYAENGGGVWKRTEA